MYEPEFPSVKPERIKRFAMVTIMFPLLILVTINILTNNIPNIEKEAVTIIEEHYQVIDLLLHSSDPGIVGTLVLGVALVIPSTIYLILNLIQRTFWMVATPFRLFWYLRTNSRYIIPTVLRTGVEWFIVWGITVATTAAMAMLTGLYLD
jgi:hypothetical protein